MPVPWNRMFGDARYWLQKLPTDKWVISDRRAHLYKEGEVSYPFPQGFRVFDTFYDVLAYMNPNHEMCLKYPCYYTDSSGCLWQGLCVLDKGHEGDHSPVQRRT